MKGDSDYIGGAVTSVTSIDTRVGAGKVTVVLDNSACTNPTAFAATTSLLASQHLMERGSTIDEGWTDLDGQRAAQQHGDIDDAFDAFAFSRQQLIDCSYGKSVIDSAD